MLQWGHYLQTEEGVMKGAESPCIGLMSRHSTSVIVGLRDDGARDPAYFQTICYLLKELLTVANERTRI
jgi:hypothetical protein